MANIMYTSKYEGKFCKLSMLESTFYIRKQTYRCSDRVANNMYHSHYDEYYCRRIIDQMYGDYNNQLTIGH